MRPQRIGSDAKIATCRFQAINPRDSREPDDVVIPLAMLTAANLLADHLPAADRVRHGFFTREGGVSRGLLASLNCGYAAGDDHRAVAANRARAMERIGMPPDSLCMVKQVHGTVVCRASTATPGPSAVEADALVTDRPGIALGVLSADCAPVLAVDPEAGIAGAAHAGWRGALAGVVEAMIEAMTDLGARHDRLAAAIGPCIARQSYEVGPDMMAAFERADPAAMTLFEPVGGGDRCLFDLKAYVLARLARAGVGNRMALPDDTFTDETRFFSARRSRNRGEPRFGLLLSAIALAR